MKKALHPKLLVRLIYFSQLFIADAPMKKKSQNLVLSPCRAILGHTVNHPWTIALKCFKSIFNNKDVDIFYRISKISIKGL